MSGIYDSLSPFLTKIQFQSYSFLPVVLAPIAVTAILLCFLSGVSDLAGGHSREERQQLEDVLHRATVACYSVEGFYPPDLNYLEEHYGVQINHHRYIVSYIPVAENLMPDSTVLEK